MLAAAQEVREGCLMESFRSAGCCSATEYVLGFGDSSGMWGMVDEMERIW